MSYTDYLNSHIGIYFGAEFIGTFILLLFVSGSVAAVKLKKTLASGGNFLFTAIGTFLGVFAGVMVALSIVENYIDLPFNTANANKIEAGTVDASAVATGFINPIFSIAFMIRGIVTVQYGFVSIAAQFLGAALGQIFVFLTFYNHYKETKDQDAIAATFYVQPTILTKRNWVNLFVEFLAAFMLVFLAGWAQSSVGKLGLPFNSAWVVFSVGVGVGTVSAYSLNPARDLMPRLLHQILPVPNKGKTNWKYAYVNFVGTVGGGIVAGLLTPGTFIPSTGDLPAAI